MKKHDVQGIDLQVTEKRAFTYITDPSKLPQWTNAFKSVGNGRALLQTPNGEVEIGLVVQSSQALGTIDWVMTFPDGSVSVAYSRIVKLDSKNCIFILVLTPPPVPLEMLEGALEEQSLTLTEELHRLKKILESNG